MATTTTTRPLGSASDTTLADGTRPSSRDAPEAAPAALSPPEPDSKHDAYHSGATTRAASPVAFEKETAAEAAAGSVKAEESAASPDSDEMEYPTGMTFTFIIVALVLSIFLVSLDMVRTGHALRIALKITAVHRHQTNTRSVLFRPSSRPPSPKLQMSSRACRMWPGTARPSS